MEKVLNRLISKCAQFSISQLNQIDKIRHIENATSDSEVIRNALDFYVEKKYPNLLKIED